MGCGKRPFDSMMFIRMIREGSKRIVILNDGIRLLGNVQAH